MRGMIVEKAVLNANELLRIVELEAQRSRSFDGRADLFASGTLFVDQRLIKRDPESQLAADRLRRLGRTLDLPEGLAEMTDSFRERKAACRTFRRFQVKVDGPLRRGGLGKMPCDDLRQSGLTFERRGQAQMNRAPPLAQQGGVSGILHQRMFERVRRVGRLTVSDREPGLLKLAECLLQRFLWKLRQTLQQIEGKLSA